MFRSVSGITGAEGVAKVGSIVAATLTDWDLTPVPATGAWRFTGRIKTVDEYWSTQQPDTLVLTFGGRTWRWTRVPLEIGGGHVQATLPGAPEER